MNIDVRKILLAGTAVMTLAALTSGEAQAQCATTGNIAADCTFTAQQTTGAITLNAGVDVTFSSAGGTVTIRETTHTINSATADGQGSLATAGNGTTVTQNAAIGDVFQINNLAVGAGDVWYISSSALNLASTGVLTLGAGSTLSVGGSGSQINTNGGDITGAAGGASIKFISAGGHRLTAGDITMGSGADDITFEAAASGLSDEISFASVIANSVDMGDGADNITFSSGGAIDVGSGTLNLGAGDDTVTFSSAGLIIAGTVNGGAGTDAVNFQNGEFSIFSQYTGIEAIGLSSGSLLYVSAGGGIDNAAITLSDNTSLFFQSTGGTISGSITGNGGIQLISAGGGTISSTINLAGGADTIALISSATLSGATNMGAGNDTMTLNGGIVTGAVDFGADTDALQVEGDSTVSGAMSNLEEVYLNDSLLVVSSAISGLNANGVDVGSGVLALENGASIGGAIDGLSTGFLIFGSAATGTWNLGGNVTDVQVMVTSGAVDTNGFVMDSPVMLGSAGTLTLSSAGGTYTIRNTINGATANGQGSVQTAGDGTTVMQNADIGDVFLVNSMTVGPGDVWYVSGSSIELGSAGLTLNGGELVMFASGATLDTNGGDITGSAGADTITFTSGGAHRINADAIALGAGADLIEFDATGGALGVNFSSVTAMSLDMGDGNDVITFNSGGRIDVGSGTVNLGAGDDTMNLNSAGSIIAATVDGGTGTDTANFANGDALILSQYTGVENINMTTGNVLFFSAGSGVANAAISLGANNAGLVFNSSGGTISGTITGGAGAQTVTLAADGTISSAIDLGAGADAVNYNSGSITGVVAFGADADTLNIGGNVTIGAAMSGLETVIVGANTLVIEAAVTGVDDADGSGLDASGSVLEINGGGSVDGAIHGDITGTVTFGADSAGGTFNLGGLIDDVQVFVSSGTLNTNGFDLGTGAGVGRIFVSSAGAFTIADDVTIASNGISDFFANLGTVTLGHDATVDAGNNGIVGGGTYNVMYFNSAGTSMTGLFETAGSIDFSSATFVFSVASGSGVVQTGDNVVTFASAGVAATGPLAGAVSDTSFLYDFAVDDLGTDLALDITQGMSLAEATSNDSNLAVATILLTDPALANTTDPVLLALQGAASAAATEEEFNNVLEQAQPTADGSSVTLVASATNNSSSMVSDRLGFLRTGDEVTGMTTGDITRGLRGWFQGFGATGEQDRRDNVDGFDFDTYGVAAGLDTENIHEDMVLGVAFTYADTSSDSDNGARTNTETDSYIFTLYGDRDFANNIYLNGMAAYGFSDIDTTRTVAGASAQGDFDASQFTLRAELGRDFKHQDVTFTPNVMGHWTHYDPDSYSETGAGGAGLAVDPESVDITELGVGLDIGWAMHNADGTYFTPELSFGYRYDLTDDPIAMTSRFLGGGAAFTTNGFDRQQSALDIGVGFTYYTTGNVELTAEYDYEVREDFNAHAGMARAAYRF